MDWCELNMERKRLLPKVRREISLLAQDVRPQATAPEQRKQLRQFLSRARDAIAIELEDIFEPLRIWRELESAARRFSTKCPWRRLGSECHSKRRESKVHGLWRLSGILDIYRLLSQIAPASEMPPNTCGDFLV
jgi:hypothetical protein